MKSPWGYDVTMDTEEGFVILPMPVTMARMITFEILLADAFSDNDIVML